MHKFSSTADMLQQTLDWGWEKIETGRGYRMVPPPDAGEGYIEVWGDPESHCYVDSDVVFYAEQLERYYFSDRGLKVTFSEDATMSYYQKRAEITEARFGTYCYVNNVPQPWFKRWPAGFRQKCSTIMVLEKFFTDAGMAVPEDDWDRAAHVINGQEGVYPELAAICRDVKTVPVSDGCFPMYLHAKAMETAALMFDIAWRLEKDEQVVTRKSRQAAKKALAILSETYLEPPSVETLARMVGVNKGTLQKGFRQTAGQSIHEYVRAMRMEKALTYLEDSSLRMEDISRLTGYQSKVHFFNAFKTIYGCTPGQLAGHRRQALSG